MVDPDFAEIHKRHNGERYLTPFDLAVTDVKPRRVLVVGSCLAEVWPDKIDCPCDFFMTNNLNQLPDQPPQPVDAYDLQLVQISLRFIIRDDAFWHASFTDIAVYEEALEQSIVRMQQFLKLAMRWNQEHGLLTFVANFLVPQQNTMGRFAPRYDLRNPVYFIEQMNFHLAKEVETYKNAHILDIDSITNVLGKRYIQDDTTDLQTHASLLGNTHYEMDLKRIEPIAPMTDHYVLLRDHFLSALWYHANAMYKTLRQEESVKLVIVDLDNTLWRGLAVEDELNRDMVSGWPLGVVESLSYLKKRGIILAIASQNDEERIVEFWDKLMLGRIKLSDFAVVKINWHPKAEKVEEILNLVNILPRNTLFIDDNPVERASVKAAFPEIRTLGKYPYYLKRILLWSPETQVPMISKESARRTEMIQAQVERETSRKQMSREEFLASLNLEVRMTSLNTTAHADFARAFELINKTNQFNTTGKRWTREECEACFGLGWAFYTFSVKDRFTDYGLVGCALVYDNVIEQFVMSCRVLGLDVENQIIGALVGIRKNNGAASVIGRMAETSTNFPCRNLYEKCGFTRSGDDWIIAT